MSAPGPARILGGLGAAALFSLGAMAGSRIERSLIGRFLPDHMSEADEFGRVRSTPFTVIADDGTALIAEVDDAADPAADDVTIIFSHGYCLSMDSWHFVRRDLRGEARLVFWDQRSHGRSGRGSSESHSIDQLGRDLGRIVADVAPRGPVILVGHSMGGMTVMALAEQQPELFGDRVLGVGLIATSSGRMEEVNLGMPRVAMRLLHARSRELSAIAKRQQPLIDRSRAKMNDLTYLITHLYSFGGRVSPEHAKFVAEMLAATPFDVVADFAPELSQHDKVAGLAAMHRVEALVMVGDHDLMTPMEHSREIVRHVPGAELVILPATGHMIITEQHEQVSGHLRRLLADVRNGLAQ